MSYIFGYPRLYANQLNSNTQIRRSTDMIYQRGGTYEVVLTGDTYVSSMEMDFNMYVNEDLVGSMGVVPYSTTQTGSTYYYRFNFRPYDYISNFVESQHYQNYYLNDWYSTTELINLNNPYPNIVNATYRYGYRYINASGATITEYTNVPVRVLNHYTDIPYCYNDTAFVPSGFTNTGGNFNYVGGQFQMNDKFILQNFDQEIGSVIGTGLTINSVDIYRRLSPMSQFLMDYPTLPEQSETSRFLTESPRIQYIQDSENYVLFYLNGQTGDRQVIEANVAVFDFYNESNVKISGFTQQLNFSGTTYAAPTGYTDTLSIFALPCGPVDIYNIFSTIDFNTIAYYTVQLFSSTPNGFVPVCPVSETFYFYLYNNCQPENTRICWLNERGGYDYFTFTSYRQDTKKITRQTYDSRYYATDLSTSDRNIGRTIKTFATDVDEEIVLESEYINIPVANWLEGLFLSPQVYIMNDDFISKLDRQDKFYKDLRPVQILSSEVETITKKHRKLNKYRITLKSATTTFVNKGF